MKTVNVQPLQQTPAANMNERTREADHPSSLVMHFGADQPLKLDCGLELSPFQIAYQTYGQLNAERSNAILLCHALTGDQHVANKHPVTGKGGWWDTLVGPGLPIDTDRYFVICSNVLGSCMGSSGPASPDAATGAPLGMHFPVITIADMVRAQAMLLGHLGIDRLHAVVGGFHLSGARFEPLIEPTCDAFARLAPDYLVPTHCTGWRAIHALASRFPDAFLPNAVGTRLEFAAAGSAA